MPKPGSLLHRMMYQQEPPKPTVAGSQTGDGPPQVLQQPPAPVPTVRSGPGTVQSDMLTSIRGEVFNKNETAYTRLLFTADKMKAAIPDETTRLKAAVSVAGVTPTDLAGALSVHTQALHGVRERFAAEAQRNRSTKIDAKKARRGDLAQKVNDLDQQLAALRAEDAQLAGQISEAEANIRQTEADFGATADAVEQEIIAANNKAQTLFT